MIRADIKEIKKVINDNIDVIAKFKESEKLLHLLEVMSRLIIESDNMLEHASELRQSYIFKHSRLDLHFRSV